MRIKRVKWRWDCGVFAPFCPYCNELAYEREKCVFCGQPYKWVRGKHEPTVIEEGEYTIMQGTGKSIYIWKGNRIVYHASCTKILTEDELREHIAYYKKAYGGAENE